jgi:hypothetical protein
MNKEGTPNNNTKKRIQQVHPAEVVETSLSTTEMLDRTEIDVQIATAHRFPRSIEVFQKNAMSMATMNEETAASCKYILPRGGKVIEGPGVRLAEIVGACWGNMRYAARVVRIENREVVCEGMAHDLENNVACKVEVRRRITNKYGKRFNEDMITVTANAACSIALRNAIFKVVPKAFVDPIYKQANKVAIGDEKTLATRRLAAIQYFASIKVPKEKLLAYLKKEGIEDINLKDLELLTGLRTAIQEGTTTVEDVFGDKKPQEPKRKSASEKEKPSSAGEGKQEEVDCDKEMQADWYTGKNSKEGDDAK